MDQVVEEFNALPYVKQWYRHHDKWTDFWDEADQIQVVLFLLEKFRLFSLEKLLPLYQKVQKVFERDDFIQAARQEFLHLSPEFRYVVYGHTHEPKNVALRVVHTPEQDKADLELLYINTGTWRICYHKCTEGLDFIGWKNMTYVVFYRPEERGLAFPSFSTWTGALKNF